VSALKPWIGTSVDFYSALTSLYSSGGWAVVVGLAVFIATTKPPPPQGDRAELLWIQGPVVSAVVRLLLWLS